MHRRNALPAVDAALGDTPVVLLHGARQVGKTTLARQIAARRPRRAYATLDDGAELSAALADPEGFVRGLAGPVVLDEIQRAPELFRAIKASVDRDRAVGRFLLTGSANVMLLPRLSESLAGRIEIVTLWPFSQGEIEGHVERFIDQAFAAGRPDWAGAAPRSRPLLERVLRGGFPEPIERPDANRRNAWYAAYIDTTLRRDVRDLANIEGLSDLPRLLALLASRMGGLLNYSDLSRGLAIPQTTLKRYFTLLEATFLAMTVPAWSNNRGLRLTKSPKLLIADTGLAAHLVGADLRRLRDDGALRGAMLENFVAMELIKQRTWSKTKPEIHHFRTSSGQEVDIVLEDRAGRVVGIEVKSATTIGTDDFRGLRALREAAGTKFLRGIVLHDGSRTVQFDDRLLSAPIAALWGSV